MAAADWSEKTRMIITIAVAAVVNIGLGTGLYFAREEWLRLDKIHKAKMEQKRKLTEFVEQEQTRKDELKSLTERFRDQEKQLPDVEEVAKFVVDISRIAENNKCKRKSFIKSPAGAGGGIVTGVGGAKYAQETWSSKWEADFMGFCKLINEVEEKFPRFIAFEGLIIAPKNQGVVAMGETHDISVNLVTYRYEKVQQP